MLTIANRKDGRPIDVVEALSLRGSPEGHSFCPSTECGLRVGPVSGHRRVDGSEVRAHFRHEKGSASIRPCWGGDPEGGLHYAAKLYLREGLQKLVSAGGVLRVEQPCIRCGRGVTYEALRFEQTDTVRIEHWLDPRKTLKPDVVVLRGGSALFCFEIRAAHPCSKKKLHELKSGGRQMVEVEAQVLVGSDRVEEWWDVMVPLPVKDAVLPVSRQQCDQCKEVVAREMACAQKEEEWRQRARAKEHQSFEMKDGFASWVANDLRSRTRPAPIRYSSQQRPDFWSRLRTRVAPQLMSMRWTVIAHCLFDICQPDGSREEHPILLLERDDNGRARLQMFERGDLCKWNSGEVMDSDWLMGRAREFIAERFERHLEPGAILDDYHGLRQGLPRSLPEPGLWWDSMRRCWVRAVRREHLLRNRTGLTLFDLETRLPHELFRRISVLTEEHGSEGEFPAYEPLTEARIENFLREP